MQKIKYILSLMMFCSFAVNGAAVIKNIRFEGNKVTQESVFNREIYIAVGDELDEKLVEKSRQAIMDLGLFKTVKYYLQENNTEFDVDETVSQLEVVFIVEEKYYVLVIPRARINDDERLLGLQLHWDNVWGLNHEMRGLIEDRGSTQGISENRNSFSYYYPNMNNSAYNMQVSYLTINEVDETEGIIDRQDETYELSISHWQNKRGRNRGWFFGGSVKYQQRYNDVISGDLLSEYVDAVIFGIESGFKDISEYEYNRGGKSYGYTLDWADARIGSDDEFTRQLLYYQSYYRFDNYPASNLNVQMRLGHSNSDILGDTAFSLGSSDDLRGYESDRFNGNSMFLTNIEYMFPHYKYPVLRYVYFIDFGNTAEKLKGLFHEPLHAGVGFGLRWKLRSFVKVDLRADFGYGLTDKDYKFSFGTRHAF